MRSIFLKYDVAVSFAEEDRPFVEQVVAELSRLRLIVYYDAHARADSLGENLYSHLDDVYRKKAAFCAMFISASYKQKRWAQYERERALQRANDRKKTYILPVVLGDAPITEQERTVGYLGSDKHTVQELAEIMLEKIRRTDRFYGMRRRMRPVIRAGRYIVAFMAVLLTVWFLREQLTPVEVLARTLYDKSSYYPAICRDGWQSRSAGGPGTCSYHDGVDHISDTLAHRRTMEDCRREADGISWLP